MKRGYSRPSLQRALTRVRTIPRHETHKQQEHTDSTRDRTPFVITFNPALYKVSSVLKKYRTVSSVIPTAKTPSLCRLLLLTDVTQAFVTFRYTPRYTTTHLTRNNQPEFTNAIIQAVSPVLFSRKAEQIRFLPQLMNKCCWNKRPRNTCFCQCKNSTFTVSILWIRL